MVRARTLLVMASSTARARSFLSAFSRTSGRTSFPREDATVDPGRLYLGTKGQPSDQPFSSHISTRGGGGRGRGWWWWLLFHRGSHIRISRTASHVRSTVRKCVRERWVTVRIDQLDVGS